MSVRGLAGLAAIFVAAGSVGDVAPPDLEPVVSVLDSATSRQPGFVQELVLEEREKPLWHLEIVTGSNTYERVWLCADTHSLHEGRSSTGLTHRAPIDVLTAIRMGRARLSGTLVEAALTRDDSNIGWSVSLRRSDGSGVHVRIDAVTGRLIDIGPHKFAGSISS